MSESDNIKKRIPNPTGSGLYVNDIPVTDPDMLLTEEHVKDGYIKLSRGKKKHVLLKVVDENGDIWLGNQTQDSFSKVNVRRFVDNMNVSIENAIRGDEAGPEYESIKWTEETFTQYITNLYNFYIDKGIISDYSIENIILNDTDWPTADISFKLVKPKIDYISFTIKSDNI